MNETARCGQLKRRFLRFPIIFAASAVYATLVVWSGILPLLPVIGCAFGGILSTRESLSLMRCPPSPSVGVLEYLRNYKVGWGFLGMMCCIGATDGFLEKLHGWLLFFGFTGSISSMLAGQTLLFWVFREPFWQFVTGTSWSQEPPNQNKRLSLEPSYRSLPHVPVAAQPFLPFNY